MPSRCRTKVCFGSSSEASAALASKAGNNDVRRNVRRCMGGFMRGRFRDQGGLFSYLSPEARVPAKHPLRQVRELVRAVLKDLSPSFGKLYSSAGRPSIPPEQLRSALLLQVFYGIRSERQLMEQLDYNLLYRWFAGLAPDR